MENKKRYGTDRNLFTNEPDGKIVVNFIYDERQARADEEEDAREVVAVEGADGAVPA